MEIQLWKEILMPYELAVEELSLKFNHIIKEYRESGLYSPIEEVSGRVKSIASILEKAHRKDIAVEEIEEKMQDIAGIRLICQFVEDIYQIADIIRGRTDMDVIGEKDYIKHMKPSGYQSLHIIVEYQVYTINGKKKIPVEIQIRTMGMNFWATIEHSLQYKYSQNIPEHIRKRLNAASAAILSLDKEMSSIHGEIMDAQNSHTVKVNIVEDILRNIESLYKVANKQEIIKIQDEFYAIYKTGDFDRLVRFNRQLDVIAEGYRAQTL
jgi:putative GTP pyrophosphokinase